jgi:hypothetical protein
MRRIGTISSAAGLIFLGVWMIISKTNPSLGAEVFKWWPAIIVVLGLEVLLMLSKREGEKVRINYLIIPVLLILLSVNIYQGLRTGIGNILRNVDIGNVPEIRIGGLDIENSKKLEVDKTIPLSGTRLYFSTDNAKINIKKSTDGNIRISGDVFVDNDGSIEKYDIAEKKDAEGYTIDINESFIRKAELDIYIPEGYNAEINVDNLDIRSDDKFVKSSFDIDSKNCNLRLEGAAAAVMNFDNANVNIEDIRDLKIKGSNVNVNGDGEIENINIESQLGRVAIDNELCKNVSIDMNQGVVTFTTDDRNLKLNIDIDQGVVEENSSKLVNAGTTRTFGTGLGNVKIKINQGAVKFSN